MEDNGEVCQCDYDLPPGFNGYAQMSRDDLNEARRVELKKKFLLEFAEEQ